MPACPLRGLPAALKLQAFCLLFALPALLSCCPQKGPQKRLKRLYNCSAAAALPAALSLHLKRHKKRAFACCSAAALQSPCPCLPARSLWLPLPAPKEIQAKAAKRAARVLPKEVTGNGFKRTFKQPYGLLWSGRPCPCSAAIFVAPLPFCGSLFCLLRCLKSCRLPCCSVPLCLLFGCLHLFGCFGLCLFGGL